MALVINDLQFNESCFTSGIEQIDSKTFFGNLFCFLLYKHNNNETLVETSIHSLINNDLHWTLFIYTAAIVEY